MLKNTIIIGQSNINGFQFAQSTLASFFKEGLLHVASQNNVAHSQKRAFCGSKITINVEKYATDETANIQYHLHSHNHIILKGATGIGKTTLIASLEKSRKIRIIALPRILNVNSVQQDNGFTNYDAIHSDQTTLQRNYTSTDILCCHKGLLNIIKSIGHSDIEVIIDEFHALIQNLLPGELDALMIELKRLKVIFVSATIDNAFGFFYTNKMIEIVQSNPHKHDITIYTNYVEENKELHKDIFIDWAINQTVANNDTALIFVENKTKINELVEKYSTKYKVASLHQNTESEDKSILISQLKGKKVDYDIVFFTSTVEAGINVNIENCHLFIIDTFMQYSSINGNKKAHNPLRIRQLIGRERIATKVSLYTDFNKKEYKKPIDYQTFKNRLHLEDYDITELNRQNSQFYDNIGSNSDSFIDFDSEGNAYFSESKIMQRYLDDKFNHLSNESLAIELGATIVEWNAPTEKLKKVIDDTKTTRKEFKQLIKDEIVLNTDMIVKFGYETGALSVNNSKNIYHFDKDVQTTDLEPYRNDFIKHNTVVKEIVKRYFVFAKKSQNSKVLSAFLELDKKESDLAMNRINHETKNQSFRNPDTIQCVATKQQAILYKKFSQRVKKNQKSNGAIKSKNLIKLAYKVFNKHVSYSDIIKILNIYYNVEYTDDAVTKLLKITKKNTFYINIDKILEIKRGKKGTGKKLKRKKSKHHKENKGKFAPVKKNFKPKLLVLKKSKNALKNSAKNE